MDWILDILKTTGTIGSAGAVAGAVIALTNKLIDHLFTTQREKAYLENQHKLTEALEATKTMLSARSLEHEIRLRSIIDKQVTVVAETYSRLLSLNREVAALDSLYTVGAPQFSDLAERAREASKSFNSFYYERAVFIPESLHEQIIKVADMLVDMGNNLVRIERDAGQQHRYSDERIEVWTEQYLKLNNEVPALLKELRQQFQALLGIAKST